MPIDEKKLAKILRYAADEIDPPLPPPEPVPDLFPGARVFDPAKWEPLYESAFDKLAAEGKFLETYPDWDAYPSSYQTTSKKGIYSKENISVVDLPDGKRVLQCRSVPKKLDQAGKVISKFTGTAPYPKAARGKSLGLEMQVRVPKLVPGHHLANLTWPTSEKWPGDGEFDFLEFSTNVGVVVAAFYHHMNGASGSSQTPMKSSVSPTDWFTVGFEVVAGVSAKWFVNGQQLGEVIGAKVTTVEHRLVLQNEDDNDKATEELLVQYNWLRVYKPKA